MHADVNICLKKANRYNQNLIFVVCVSGKLFRPYRTLSPEWRNSSTHGLLAHCYNKPKPQEPTGSRTAGAKNDVFGRAFQKDPSSPNKIRQQRLSFLLVETESKRIWVPSPGRKPSSFIRAIQKKKKKTLLGRPASRVANSALGASPEPSPSTSLGPAQKQPTARRDKAENPSKTSPVEPFSTARSREKPEPRPGAPCP